MFALHNSHRAYKMLALHNSHRTYKMLAPHIYSMQSRAWQSFESDSGEGSLEPGRLLRVVSWNISFDTPSPELRAITIIDYLEAFFGNTANSLVIMLQEVNRHSLTAILKHPWTRKNFITSNAEPPPQRYFTLIMVSQRLKAKNWFRVPFTSEMQRDALVVDISVLSNQEDDKSSQAILRLCTTHLESLSEPMGKEIRPRQLATISALLKAPRNSTYHIVGGLVGGDMNAISELDEVSHNLDNVDLRDIWENIATSHTSLKNLSEEDTTLGRAEGHTWGYQPPSIWSPKRLDKFLCTGAIEAVVLSNKADLSRKIAQLGIGLKARSEALEPETPSRNLFNSADTDLKDIDVWVSDHFGIAIGIKIEPRPTTNRINAGI